MTSLEAGPSQQSFYSAPSISGSTPGLIDPSQPSRLLRWPGSRLSFASFDPRTAFVEKEIPDIHKLSLKEELYRPKRVVIETSPTGESFWRFVPKARREEGVENEGSWPRLVDICGELVQCSQEQWDIYKLDPEYDCLVQVYPNISVISRATFKGQDTVTSAPSHASSSKRPVPVTPSPRKRVSPLNTQKKSRKNSSQGYSMEEEWSSDEEDEVEEMIVDGDRRGKSAGAGERSKKFRETIEQNRRSRRERIARASAKGGQNGEVGVEDLDMFDFTEVVPAAPRNHTQNMPESTAKRKVSSVFESLRAPRDPGLKNGDAESYRQTHKRHRTLSPASQKREMAGRRSERERRKRTRMEQRLNGWREHKHQSFMSNILSEVPEFGPYSNDPAEGTDDASGSESDEDAHEAEAEAARQAAIEESRRKLAQLEADRPLWEREAHKRAERERAEDEVARARAAERKRAQEQEADAARREQRRQEEQERAESLKQEQKLAARREHERRQQQQRARWSFGPWTSQRALERYRTLSEEFDSTKFSADEPLTFEAVPWPVLHSPVAFSIEDVDWGAVEKFFEAVRPRMRAQDYKTFVETSHRRFHPDRWRSRRLLTSVADDAERGCLEVAANTVAQALTPLWRELKG